MSPRSPDYVLHNAQIYTVDDECPRATAFAVRDGHFVDVGAAEVLLNRHPGSRRLDAEGGTVVPGLIDAHAHLHALGHSLRRADLSDATSARDAVDHLVAFADDRDLPEDAWLRGHGWNDAKWAGRQAPSRTLLDAAFPHRPVWLIRADIHAGWANTAALEASIGLDRLRRMGDPDGGAIRRDADGTPTGVLVDAAMGLVEDHLPPPTAKQRERALSTALDHAARHGLTGLHDAGVGLGAMRRFRRFINANRFPLRVYAMINGRGDTLDHFCERGAYHGPRDRLRVEAVKFFADGALGSRGAALLDDYTDDPGTRGLLLQSPEQLRTNVQAAVDCGFQVCTHAIGDRANRLVLDAYEAARTASDNALRRPRLEHAQIVHPDDRPRLGALNAIASVQPLFATSDKGWVADRLGPDRLDRAYAWRSLQAAGAPLVFGSDAPVEPIDPIRGFHAAVTRQDADGQPSGGWQPQERVSRATALHAYTQGAAAASFHETTVGSITPGTRADFVVLSQDLLQVPADALLDTAVVATYLDGRPTHTAAGWPAG
ncbi:MAG: amidohydrolase [Salinibacter sp.]